MPRSEEITGGFIITEHYQGEVVNFWWFETQREAERFSTKHLDRNESTYIIAEVIGKEDK